MTFILSLILIACTQALSPYEHDVFARLEFLEKEIIAKEARIMELRRRRKPKLSVPRADGDFVPTLPSCEEGNQADLTQMWVDACQIAQNYQNMNYKILNFQEAIDNQMTEDMEKSELGRVKFYKMQFLYD